MERKGGCYRILEIVLFFSHKPRKEAVSSAIMNLPQSPNWKTGTCYSIRIWPINSENIKIERVELICFRGCFFFFPLPSFFLPEYWILNGDSAGSRRGGVAVVVVVVVIVFPPCGCGCGGDTSHLFCRFHSDVRDSWSAEGPPT